jgi:beta-lactamase regulating signal transducer with metallopeptidase domain
MRAADLAWAVAAILPLSAAGLAAGAALERAGVSAKVRERVFSLGYWLGPAAALMTLAADDLPQATTAQITVVLRATPLGALSRATHSLAPHVPMPGLTEIVLALIALGAALRLAQLGRAWLSLRALRRGALAAPEDTVSAIRAAGVGSIPIKLSAGASTPVAAGLFRPEILLPDRLAEPGAAALVCRHEAQHVRRGDNLRLLLEQLAGALLWFDPLRGLLHRRLLAAREERCDAQALAGCTAAERDLYARTLLDALTQPGSSALAVALTGAGRSHAMARISAVIDPRPAPPRPLLTIAVCALLTGAATGVAFAASQAGQPAPDGVKKIVEAAAAMHPPAPVAPPPHAPAPVKGRAHAAHAKPVAAIGAEPVKALAESTEQDPLSGLVDDGMVMFVNGDMDTGDLRQLALQLAASRGITPSPDNMPLLEQAVLRSAPEEPRVDIAADYVQKFDSATRFAGNVVLSGDLRHAFEDADVMVDGRPAPAGLILSSRLVAEAVELKRIQGVGPGKVLSVHIHGLRSAQ